MKKLTILLAFLTGISFADSTKVDNLFELSHHVNTRSVSDNKYDWYLNLDLTVHVNSPILREIYLFGSREREKGIEYKSYAERISGDYFMIDKVYDEEDGLDFLHTAIFIELLKVKHGMAVLEDSSGTYYGIYHQFKYKFLLAEIHYWERAYKLNVELDFKQKFKYNFFGSAVAKYLILNNKDHSWKLGYKIGWGIK